MLLTRIGRFCLMGTISSFVKLESVVSSSLTWNGYFHYHTCSLYLFTGTWTGTWSRRSRVLRSRGSPIVSLSLSAIVGRSLSYSQARWSRSFQHVKLLSKLWLLSAGSWNWRVNIPNLTFRSQDGYTRQQLLGGQRWSASSLRNWRATALVRVVSRCQGRVLRNRSKSL